LPKEQTLDWQIAPSDEQAETNGVVVNGQHAEFGD
jgi:hypothetical protein